MELMPLLQSIDPALPEAEKETLVQRLAHHVNHLIAHDFERLVHLLYTVDVSEKKLKAMLQAQPQRDAGEVIAELLVARQEQKAQSRQQHATGAPPDDAEKW